MGEKCTCCAYLVAGFSIDQTAPGNLSPRGRCRLYYATKEKAKQLEPFAETATPLIIALANPGRADVNLDPHEVVATLFGTLIHRTPATLLEACEAPKIVAEPGYGVFCGTDQNGRPKNAWPHISGVAVLSNSTVTYYDLAGYRLGAGSSVPDSWFTGPRDRRLGFASDGVTFGPDEIQVGIA